VEDEAEGIDWGNKSDGMEGEGAQHDGYVLDGLQLTNIFLLSDQFYGDNFEFILPGSL
jgi:hypothetical protein